MSLSYTHGLCSYIGTISLSCEPKKLDIGECPIHLPTIATIVENRTVDKLLFREINSIVSLLCKNKSWFECPCCRESPARSTLTLILNRSYSSSSNPVNTNVNIGILILGDLIDDWLFDDEIEVCCSEFFLSEISEECNT